MKIGVQVSWKLELETQEEEEHLEADQRLAKKLMRHSRQQESSSSSAPDRKRVSFHSAYEASQISFNATYMQDPSPNRRRENREEKSLTVNEKIGHWQDQEDLTAHTGATNQR